VVSKSQVAGGLLVTALFTLQVNAVTINVPSQQATTIQAGIDIAANGDTVVVASGTYSGTGFWDLDFQGKGIVVTSAAGAESTIIRCADDSPDGWHHRGVWFRNSEDSTSVLDGITFTQTPFESSYEWGGGVRCDTASPTIRNCVFSEINMGGAIYCLSSSPRILNCQFVGNSSGFSANGGNYPNGGAISFTSCASPLVQDCVFQSNFGDEKYGGAIAADSSTLTVMRCTFEDNGVGNADGGAGFFTNGVISFQYCEFRNNRASGGDGGALALGGEADLSLDYCIFEGNHCSDIFYGGAIACGQWKVRVTNCTFYDNYVDYYEPTPNLPGAAIHCTGGAELTIQSSLFAFNRNGGAIGCSGVFAPPSISCTNIYGNLHGNWASCTEGLNGVNGNFSLDPLFLDTAASDFRIEPSSPCAPDGNSCSRLIGADSLEAISISWFGVVPRFMDQGQRLISVAVWPQVDAVWLYSRQGGSSAWDSIPMSEGNGGLWTGDIPIGVISSRGIECFVAAASGEITGTIPQAAPRTNPHRIQVTLDDEATSFGSGQRWHLVSLPFDLDVSTNVSTTLVGDDLGPASDTTWRLGHWDIGLQDYASNDGIGQIKRKKGYWFWTHDSTPIDADGLSALPDTLIGDLWYDTLVLAPGWNQIGAPFAFRVDWADCERETGIDPVIWSYESGVGDLATYTTADALEPFKGYFVYNNAIGTRVLRVPCRESSVARVSDMRAAIGQEGASWLQSLELRGADATDRDNLIGAVAGAETGPDQFDYSEPPPYDRYVSLAFLSDGRDGGVRRLAGDIRPAAGNVWLFEAVVSGNLGTPARLLVSDSATLPEGYLMVLTDPSTGKSYRLAPNAPFNLPWVPDPAGHRYELTVASEGYFAIGGYELETIPGSYALHQNAPNPFNPSTVIRFDLPQQSEVEVEIFNILGRRVRQLTDLNYPAGSHELIWTGTDDHGRTVSSGVYFCRIQAAHFSDAVKMVLMK